MITSSSPSYLRQLAGCGWNRISLSVVADIERAAATTTCASSSRARVELPRIVRGLVHRGMRPDEQRKQLGLRLLAASHRAVRAVLDGGRSEPRDRHRQSSELVHGRYPSLRSGVERQSARPTHGEPGAQTSREAEAGLRLLHGLRHEFLRPHRQSPGPRTSNSTGLPCFASRSELRSLRGTNAATVISMRGRGGGRR